jgi:hypothetical protein
MELTILRMAQAIQKIEHRGYHTWESCDETARQRALEQARACMAIVRSDRMPQPKCRWFAIVATLLFAALFVSAWLERGL